MKTRLERLGDFVRIQTGKLDANASDPHGMYPFFTCAVEPLRISHYSYDCECVLVAGNGDLNVKYYFGKFDAYQRTYIIQSLDRDHLDVRYLYYFMRSYVGRLRELSIGGVIKYIKLGYLTEAKIPIPSISEQRRITAILDKGEDLIANRAASLALLSQVEKLTFLDLFGDPQVNPMGWPLLPMRKLFSEAPVFGTMTPATEELKGWLCLRVANIQNWRLDLADRKYVELEGGALARHTLRDGDIVMARAIATEEQLGKCVTVYPNGEQWAFDSHLVRLRFDRSIVDPEYVRQLLATPGGRSRFLGVSRRSAVQFNVNTKEISRLEIPVPPLALQSRFLQALNNLKRVRSVQESSKSQLDTLLACLQSRAFAGDLQP